MWLGTAAVRPYKEGVYHPKWWRGWQGFGVGWLGDMGCHIIDTPFQALKLTSPLRIRAEVEPAWWNTPTRRGETWPTWQILHYTFAGNELTADKTLEFTWSDGGKYPPDELRRQIEANSEYVGMNFAAEARRIHDGESPERSIYGQARPDEARSLLEDGIPVSPLPFVPKPRAN